MSEHKDPAGLAQAVATCLSLLRLDPDRDDAAPDHVLALINAAAAEPQVLALLDHMLPRQIDPQLWISWLQGGPAPTAPRLERPTETGAKSPTGAYLSQVKKVEKADQDVANLKARLAEAEEIAAAARKEVNTYDEHMRAAVLFAVFDLMAKVVGRATAMGPTFTLARIVSGYLRVDVPFEAKLSEKQRAWVVKHRAERGAMATRMADILDRHTGDPEFEMKVFTALFKAVTEADKAVEDELKRRAIDLQPRSDLAKRPRRRSDEQRNAVHPDAPLHDAADVLNGLAEVFDHD
jgi:hypothetical protein